MFYLIEKSWTEDAEHAAVAIWEKPDYDTALVSMCQMFASAISNTAIKTALGIIVDEAGTVLRHEYWHDPALQPEWYPGYDNDVIVAEPAPEGE